MTQQPVRRFVPQPDQQGGIFSPGYPSAYSLISSSEQYPPFPAVTNTGRQRGKLAEVAGIVPLRGGNESAVASSAGLQVLPSALGPPAQGPAAANANAG